MKRFTFCINAHFFCDVQAETEEKARTMLVDTRDLLLYEGMMLPDYIGEVEDPRVFAADEDFTLEETWEEG